MKRERKRNFFGPKTLNNSRVAFLRPEIDAIAARSGLPRTLRTVFSSWASQTMVTLIKLRYLSGRKSCQIRSVGARKRLSQLGVWLKLLNDREREVRGPTDAIPRDLAGSRGAKNGKKIGNGPVCGKTGPGGHKQTSTIEQWHRFHRCFFSFLSARLRITALSQAEEPF